MRYFPLFLLLLLSAFARLSAEDGVLPSPDEYGKRVHRILGDVEEISIQGLRIVSNCRKEGRLADGMSAIRWLAMLDPRSAQLGYLGIADKKEAQDDIDAFGRQMLMKAESEVCMSLSLECRAAELSGSTKEMQKRIEGMRAGIAPDVYLFFHSGLMAENGNRAAALDEFSQMSADFSKRIECRHPLAQGSF